VNACEVVVNTNYYIELFITGSDGKPVSGLTTSFIIYKSIDDSVISSGSLSDIGNGIYKSSYVFTEIGQYYIKYTTPSNYTDEIQTIYVVQEVAKADDLARLLGLSDENKRITDTVHDSNGNITSATVKLYSSVSDFDNDINTFATYQFSATYNSSGLMQNMGIKRLT